MNYEELNRIKISLTERINSKDPDFLIKFPTETFIGILDNKPILSSYSYKNKKLIKY